jgi:hypothetical protein
LGKDILDKTNIINPDEIIINDKNNILKDEDIHTSMKKTIIITRENTKLKYFKNNISIDKNISDYINQVEAKKQEIIKEAEAIRQETIKEEIRRLEQIRKVKARRQEEAKRQEKIRKDRIKEEKIRKDRIKEEEAKKIKQESIEEAIVKIQKKIKLEGIKNIVIINNLMWETESQKMDWNSALNYAKKLQLHEYRGWRLPTIEELKSIIQNCGGIVDSNKNKVNTQYQNCYKDKGFKEDDCYWSSNSMSPYANLAWIVNFLDGSKGNYRYDNNTYFRCVREILKS